MNYLKLFIYTPFIAVSHITVTREAPEVILFGLYGSLLHNEMKDLVLHCDFTQMNDLLHLADYVADETIAQLSDIVAAGTAAVQTVDVTEQGGINFNDLLFCLEPLVSPGQENDSKQFSEYQLSAFINKGPYIPDFERMVFPADKQAQANYYMMMLSVQYDFYLYFCSKKMRTEEALQQTGLQDELIYRLAKTAYVLRKKSKNTR